MTEFLSNSRKRIRSHSNEAPFEVQSKHFINQHILDQRDASKMKQIHDKTIQLLFKNANTPNNNNEENVITDKLAQMRSIRLIGGGVIKPLAGQQVPNVTMRTCNYCLKSSVIVAVECVNCNLELCEYCGISCSQCNEPLCLACVELFGCNGNLDDISCCQRCKAMNY